MPGALFFISFRAFFTSDAMIGGTSDESGLAMFSGERVGVGGWVGGGGGGGGWSWGLELYSSVQKHVQIFNISFLSVCILFSSFFISPIFFFGPPLYICFGPLPL